MERVDGLKKLIRSDAYRKAMKLPEEVVEQYELLAQGEYNINYIFTHPKDGKQYVLRINCGSQMHLKDQISYEYHALELLSESGRTPLPFYMDDSKSLLDHGILVMEYLPGAPLDYRTDLLKAAPCLADIHSMKMPSGHHLISPDAPLKAILEECEDMAAVYMNSDLADSAKKQKIRHMLDIGWKKLKETNLSTPWECCINTELNSTNFLVNAADAATDDRKNCYLIDWEKPLYGDTAQDLGHFLAPTTTFWKTDVILTTEEVDRFIEAYCQAVNGRYDVSGLRQRTFVYIPITCLRGITWCAMAWVQYQDSEKMIVNESTRRKLNAYLEDAYLDMILENYLLK